MSGVIIKIEPCLFEVMFLDKGWVAEMFSSYQIPFREVKGKEAV